MKTAITSTPAFPAAATLLHLADNWQNTAAFAPQFYFELWDHDDQPAVYDQATPPNLVTPASPHTVVGNGNVAMTNAQWAAWAAGGTPTSDQAYILTCAAANLGLTMPS